MQHRLVRPVARHHAGRGAKVAAIVAVNHDKQGGVVQADPGCAVEHAPTDPGPAIADEDGPAGRGGGGHTEWHQLRRGEGRRHEVFMSSSSCHATCTAGPQAGPQTHTAAVTHGWEGEERRGGGGGLSTEEAVNSGEAVNSASWMLCGASLRVCSHAHPLALTPSHMHPHAPDRPLRLWRLALLAALAVIALLALLLRCQPTLVDRAVAPGSAKRGHPAR